MTMPIALRPATEADLPFITSTWIESYIRSPATRRIPKAVFLEGHRRVIDRLLAKYNAWVACDPGDRDVLYGWSLCQYDPAALHYCYVKETRRGQGVARALIGLYDDILPSATLPISHWTPACKRARNRGVDIRWEPHLLTYAMLEGT